MASTIGQQRPKVGDHPTVEAYNLPVAAATAIKQGTLVALALSGTNDGYLVPASAASIDQRVLGVAAEDVDNSAGAAGALSCRVLVGVFPFAMGGTTNALTNKHIGKPCYASDDVTVNRLPSTNRPYAGIVRGISGTRLSLDPVEALGTAVLQHRMAPLTTGRGCSPTRQGAGPRQTPSE